MTAQSFAALIYALCSMLLPSSGSHVKIVQKRSGACATQHGENVAISLAQFLSKVLDRLKRLRATLARFYCRASYSTCCCPCASLVHASGA